MNILYRPLIALLLCIFLVGAAQAQQWPLSLQDDVPALKHWVAHQQDASMPSVLAWVHPSVAKTNGGYRPVEIMMQIRDGVGWVEAARITARYDRDTALLIQETGELRIEGFGWINLIRTTYTYDDDGNLIEVLAEAGTIFPDGWEKEARTVTTYDPDGYPTERLIQAWEETQWIDESRTLFTFTGRMLTQRLNQTWGGTAWEDDTRDTYTYPGVTMVVVTEGWDGSAWTNDHRITYFDAYYGEFYEVLWPFYNLLKENWDGTQWIYSEQTVTDYQEDGLPQQSVMQHWDGTLWVNDWRDSYSYNAIDNLDVLLGESWENNRWEKEARMLLKWSPIAKPSAVDDEITTDEDTPITLDVLANDTNPISGPLRVMAFSQPDHGTVEEQDNTLVYTPDDNFNGEDTFSYTIVNQLGGDDDATCTITINPVNHAPSFLSEPDESAPVGIEYTYEIETHDLEDDPITITIEEGPAFLTLADHTDGTATLSGTPSGDDVGEHTVTLKASDGMDAALQGFVYTVFDNPPSSPAITTPASGAHIIVGGDVGEAPLPPDDPFTASWTESTDPNGQTVTYTWQLATTQDFAEGSVLVDADAGTMTTYETTLGTIAGALDDAGVALHTSVTMWHRALASDGYSATPSPAAEITLVRGTLTSVEDEAAFPKHFALDQNYPNPFNPTTTIAYALPQTAEVRLAVYNLFGREVARLVETTQSAGRYTVLFNADGLASGIYFYRIEAGSFSQTRPLTVLK